MDRLLSDSTKLVKRITIDRGSQVVPNAYEFLTLLPIENSACEFDGNSVSVWVEGEAFSRPFSSGVSKKAKRIAARAYDVFRRLVNRLHPTYAAITCDYCLESPCDLQMDCRTYAFRDFYLRREDFGETFLSEVRRKCPHGVHQQLENGQITITTSPFLLALGQNAVVDDGGYELSRFVGERIATELAASMKARCLSMVSSEVPFLYPSVGGRPSPFGFFESGGKVARSVDEP